MKKLIILITLACSIGTAFSQIKYSKGYIVNNANDTLHCHILNVENKLHSNSPVTYKTTEKAAEETKEIADVKEVYFDNVKYIRASVRVDYSGATALELRENPAPYWKNETTFLRVLVEGKASLFEYSNPTFTRFFYSINDSAIIQLEYYNALINNTIKAFPRYKTQLAQNVRNENISFKLANTTTYTQSHLINYFETYNKQFNQTSTTFKKDTDFSFSVDLGISNSHTKVVFNDTFITAPIELTPNLGMEFSAKAFKDFDIVAKPTFTTYSTTYTYKTIVDTLTFTLIDIPFGLKYSKRFLNNWGFFVSGYTSLYSLHFVKSVYNFDTNNSDFSLLTTFQGNVGIKYKRYKLYYTFYSTMKNKPKGSPFFYLYQNNIISCGIDLF